MWEKYFLNIVKSLSFFGINLRPLNRQPENNLISDYDESSWIKTHEKVQAVIVRQKKEYRRPDGTRVKFEDNAVVILKDDKGNPKGTIFKGPIAKEAVSRWPGIAKLAGIVV